MGPMPKTQALPTFPAAMVCFSQKRKVIVIQNLQLRSLCGLTVRLTEFGVDKFTL
jgi:hypothetical protein